MVPNTNGNSVTCMRYLDPKNDLTFKKVFGEHPHLLRSFLNALLSLAPGREYKGIQPVYALSLVNAMFEPNTDLYYHHYAMIHHELTGKHIEGLELIFVELPKFKAQKWSDKKLQVLWLRYLTEIEEKTEHAPEDLLAVPEIAEALAHVQESAFTKGELETYDKYWDSVSTERTLIGAAREEGLEEGFEKGKSEGFEEGRSEGLTEGIHIGIRILTLHQEGKSISDIAKATRQTVEFVEKTLQEMGLG